jgi:hypothetical protein
MFLNLMYQQLYYVQTINISANKERTTGQIETKELTRKKQLNKRISNHRKFKTTFQYTNEPISPYVINFHSLELSLNIHHLKFDTDDNLISNLIYLLKSYNINELQYGILMARKYSSIENNYSHLMLDNNFHYILFEIMNNYYTFSQIISESLWTLINLFHDNNNHIKIIILFLLIQENNSILQKIITYYLNDDIIIGHICLLFMNGLLEYEVEEQEQSLKILEDNIYVNKETILKLLEIISERIYIDNGIDFVCTLINVLDEGQVIVLFLDCIKKIFDKKDNISKIGKKELKKLEEIKEYIEQTYYKK